MRRRKPVVLNVEFVQPDTPTEPPGDWSTYLDVAHALRCSVKTIMRWVRGGSIPSPTYFSGLARFSPQAVAEILRGPSLPGTYVVAASSRAVNGAKGPKRKKQLAKLARAKTALAEANKKAAARRRAQK